MTTEPSANPEFINFTCAACASELQAIAAAAGRLARCPACGGTSPIPESDAAKARLPDGRSAATGELANDEPADSKLSRADELPRPLLSRVCGYVPPAVPSEVAVGDIVARTWDIFYHRFLPAVLVVLVTSLASTMALTVGLVLDTVIFLSMLRVGTLEAAILVTFVVGVAALLPAVWIHVGQVLYLLKMARGQRPEWRDVLRGGPCVVNYFHVSILIGLLAAIGFVLCAVPGLLVLAVFSPAWLLVVERDLGPSAAMKAAWQLARGNVLHLLLVVAVDIGVHSLAQLIPCGMGPVLTTPFIALLWTVTYLRLTGQPTICYEYQPAAGS